MLPRSGRESRPTRRPIRHAPPADAGEGVAPCFTRHLLDDIVGLEARKVADDVRGPGRLDAVVGAGESDLLLGTAIEHHEPSSSTTRRASGPNAAQVTAPRNVAIRMYWMLASKYVS
jgi:hypothetical protein